MIRLILRFRLRRGAVAKQLDHGGISGRQWPADAAQPGGEPIHLFRRRR